MPIQGMDRQEYLKNKFGGKNKAFNVYNKINRVGKKVGIFFQFDKIKKTPNSFLSHQLLAFSYKKGIQKQIIESLFYSYFIEGKDIGQMEELIKIAKHNNLDEKETRYYFMANKDKKNLLEEQNLARKMGINGVPCFVVNNEYVLLGVPEEDKLINVFDTFIK